MAHRDEPWPPGTPCWVDLMAGNIEVTKAFYQAVLGWDYTEPDPDLGGYSNALVDGRVVAGLVPPMPVADPDGAPAAWTIYLATSDIDATDATARAHGANAIVAPMPVGDLGSMGIWADGTGTAFGAWQSRRHTGFTIANEPGSVAWIDLMTADKAAAESFYARTFSFSYNEIGMGDLPYSLFSVPEGAVPAGGIGAIQPGTPPGWSVSFEVADVDATAELARRHGGGVLTEPLDFEYGRLATLTGPDGEAFGVVASAQMDE